MSEDLNKRAAMTDEVKAAVERLTKWLRVCDEEAFFDYDELANNDIKSVLQALSRLTEENERLREVLEGLAAILTETQARATKAEAERDEALEALKPFAVNPHPSCRDGEAFQANFGVSDIRRAAALLARSAQKEGA